MMSFFSGKQKIGHQSVQVQICFADVFRAKMEDKDAWRDFKLQKHLSGQRSGAAAGENVNFGDTSQLLAHFVLPCC